MEYINKLRDEMNILKDQIESEAVLFEGKFMMKYGTCDNLTSLECIKYNKRFDKGLNKKLKVMNKELLKLEEKWFNHIMKIHKQGVDKQ